MKKRVLRGCLEHKHEKMVTWESFDAKRNNDINLQCMRH
jgi:hypothetical protein